jgi:hypothetical protein
LIIPAKNNQKFCTEKRINHDKVVGTQLNTTCVSYTLLPWLPLLLYPVKYKQEEIVENQQTKDWSRKHKICCSNEVVLGCYDCFGCITIMDRKHSTVKVG